MANRELVIGFDADDTLWHNEIIFERAHERYRARLAQYHDAATVDRTLFETEMRNLDLYGYGIKGYTLSAIETAIQLTEGKISPQEIQELIALGREMLAHPIELLEGVQETLADFAPKHRLILITKGDLLHQERKIAASGLGAYFSGIEIVSEKNEGTYTTIFRRHQIEPARFLMVGNSLKSDIMPVLALGGAGAHVPYQYLWAAEHVEKLPANTGRLFSLKTLRDLREVVVELTGR